MEESTIMLIVAGVTSFHSWITIRKLGKDIRIFKNKTAFLKSEKKFFKKTFLVKFLDQKRKECIIIVLSTWIVYAISLILILSKISLMEIPYKVETVYIVPFALFYFIFLINCFYFPIKLISTLQSQLFHDPHRYDCF